MQQHFYIILQSFPLYEYKYFFKKINIYQKHLMYMLIYRTFYYLNQSLRYKYLPPIPQSYTVQCSSPSHKWLNFNIQMQFKIQFLISTSCILNTQQPLVASSYYIRHLSYKTFLSSQKVLYYLEFLKFVFQFLII